MSGQKLAGDHHRAEDLVQTSLAKAWPHIDRVEHFEAYVRRTMLLTSDDRLRRSRRCSR